MAAAPIHLSAPSAASAAASVPLQGGHLQARAVTMTAYLSTISTCRELLEDLQTLPSEKMRLRDLSVDADRSSTALLEQIKRLDAAIGLIEKSEDVTIKKINELTKTLSEMEATNAQLETKQCSAKAVVEKAYEAFGKEYNDETTTAYNVADTALSAIMIEKRSLSLKMKEIEKQKAAFEAENTINTSKKKTLQSEKETVKTQCDSVKNALIEQKARVQELFKKIAFANQFFDLLEQAPVAPAGDLNGSTMAMLASPPAPHPDSLAPELVASPPVFPNSSQAEAFAAAAAATIASPPFVAETVPHAASLLDAPASPLSEFYEPRRRLPLSSPDALAAIAASANDTALQSARDSKDEADRAGTKRKRSDFSDSPPPLETDADDDRAKRGRADNGSPIFPIPHRDSSPTGEGGKPATAAKVDHGVAAAAAAAPSSKLHVSGSLLDLKRDALDNIMKIKLPRPEDCIGLPLCTLLTKSAKPTMSSIRAFIKTNPETLDESFKVGDQTWNPVLLIAAKFLARSLLLFMQFGIEKEKIKHMLSATYPNILQIVAYDFPNASAVPNYSLDPLVTFIYDSIGKQNFLAMFTPEHGRMPTHIAAYNGNRVLLHTLLTTYRKWCGEADIFTMPDKNGLALIHYTILGASKPSVHPTFNTLLSFSKNAHIPPEWINQQIAKEGDRRYPAHLMCDLMLDRLLIYITKNLPNFKIEQTDANGRTPLSYGENPVISEIERAHPARTKFVNSTLREQLALGEDEPRSYLRSPSIAPDPARETALVTRRHAAAAPAAPAGS